MATFNSNSATNNVNQTLWSYSTKLAYNTDRASGSFGRGAEVQSVNNLGVGVAAGDPFTLLS